MKPRPAEHRRPSGCRPLVVALAVACGLVVACSPGGSDPLPEARPSPPAASANGVPTDGGLPAGGLIWERLPAAPSSRTEVTATCHGDRIIVAGGFDEEGGTAPRVEIYDPQRRTWQRGPDLPVGVNHATSAALDGTVYVFGGYLGPGLTHPTERAFALRGDVWHELPAMPEPRAAAGAAALDGRVYVAGGVGPGGLADRTFIFDPRTAGWSTAAAPPTRREHLGVAAADGRLFVIGGRAGGIGTNLAAVESYEPAQDKWSRLPELPTPRGGIAAAATSNGFIVVPGGEARSGTFEQVEAFDLAASRWLTLAPLPTPRHGLGVAAVGTVVYVIGGGPEPGYTFSAANEALDLHPFHPPFTDRATRLETGLIEP